MFKMWNNADKVALNFKKKAEQIQNKTKGSVEDACRSCAFLWKSMMPYKSNESRMMINYIVKGNVGYVFSPSNVKQGNFYLNQFLEGVGPAAGISPGETSTTVKGRPYNLKHGFFGAGALAAERTAPFFKMLISDRIIGELK